MKSGMKVLSAVPWIALSLEMKGKRLIIEDAMQSVSPA